MLKKLLIIINPNSGQKKANKMLTDIVDVFNRADYEVTVAVTDKRGAGNAIAAKRAGDYDTVVAIGGDGTFNEVASALVENEIDIPLGYIPAGSTNDFAASLGLSRSIVQAARDIVNGKARRIDVGSFGGRIFTYVASFGAFTEASYQTPQDVKNALGHLAYVLEGIKDVSSVTRSVKMTVTVGNKIYDGSFIFGAISNSTSLGGLLRLNKKYVDMSDGKLELLLIRKPVKPIDYAQIIYALNTGEYSSCPMIDFCSADSMTISLQAPINWTLDGELEKAKKEIEVKNIPHALQVYIP